MMIVPSATLVAAGRLQEPDDSPLYAVSLHGAFADMATRDQGSLRPLSAGARVATGPETVIFVSGTKWSCESGLEWATSVGQARQAGQGRSGPLDLTWQSTCNAPTTVCASCVPTRCGGGPTCVRTCVDPGPTCMVSTCTGEPTCWGATCTPVTCVPPTCKGTCAPANCPTVLTDVRVPQAGQIELSFTSLAQLRYVLQYCTNLAEGTWAGVFTNNGTGGLLTLRHTNGAPTSAYRLLIQTP